MSTSASTIGRNPGLSNVVDIVIAPNAAFERLREVPTWGWAFVIASGLSVLGVLLSAPAMMHAIDTSLPAQLAASPSIAKLPPDKQQKTIQMGMAVTRWTVRLTFILLPVFILIGGLIQGLVMQIANAVSRGDGSFKKYFTLSINVSVVGFGLNALVVGIIVVLRGANSFETMSSVQSVVPSFALLVPSAKGALAAFLSSFNVFYLWATVLLALGMQRVGRITAPVAWTTSIVLLLLTAGFAASGGAHNG